MGPCIVTRDELPDWEAVRIQSQVNGELRQDAVVGEQIGPPAVAIEWLSSIITLDPGDCLSTGTPAGCGTFLDPPQFLNPGDVVTVSASGIGELTNPVVAGTARTNPR
jgi:2,4-didehydro-3-deoxy-L-rhamnonate hydrolase